MIVLGITGAIGSGKSTLSTMLAKNEPSHALYESRQIVSELAEDFNHALSGELAFETTSDPIELANQALIWFTEAIAERLHLNVTWNQLAITKQQLAAQPELFEKLLVYLDHVKADPNLLKSAITAENKATYRPLLQWIGGYLVAKLSPTIWFDEIFRRVLRFDSDKKLIIVNGLRYPNDAEVVKKHSGSIIEITRPGLADETNDITEASRAQITADCRVLNNGELGDLERLAEALWYDASISQLKPDYKAV